MGSRRWLKAGRPFAKLRGQRILKWAAKEDGGGGGKPPTEEDEGQRNQGRKQIPTRGREQAAQRADGKKAGTPETKKGRTERCKKRLSDERNRKTSACLASLQEQIEGLDRRVRTVGENAATLKETARNARGEQERWRKQERRGAQTKENKTG